MNFRNLTDKSKTSDKGLSEEYKAAHSYGVAAIGSDHFFVKKGFSVYYISYSDSERIFRRVRKVNAMMCCENGELEIEYIVVSANGEELIEVQLPGSKAARMMMEELKGVMPEDKLKAP